MEPIEVITHCKNPEYPTRVTIIDLYGKFVHAGDYTPPHYTFSVKVEVKFNKVIDDKEESLISCSLWTVKDSTPFNFQEDDLDEGSVEEWFLEGLSEDLSFMVLKVWKSWISMLWEFLPMRMGVVNWLNIIFLMHSTNVSPISGKSVNIIVLTSFFRKKRQSLLEEVRLFGI